MKRGYIIETSLSSTDRDVPQVVSLAKDVLLPEEEARKRTVYLAAAVFQSLIDAAFQESRKMVIALSFVFFILME